MSIPAAIHNRIVYQGTTEKLRFRSVSPAVPATYFAGGWIVDATGLALAPDQLIVTDVTGKKIRAALRKKHTDPVASIVFNEANGNVFLDAAIGIYGIDFRPTETSPLKATDDEYARDDIVAAAANAAAASVPAAVAAVKAEMLGGVGPAFDTLLELADEMTAVRIDNFELDRQRH